MLDPKLQDKVSFAYIAIGDIGLSIVLNFRKGKDHSIKQKELKDRARKLRLYLKILVRHIDTTVTPPTLYQITETQANKLIRCIEKVGKIENYPIVPTLLPTPKAVTLNKGADGLNGTNGLNGTDANILVVPDTGEDQISITSTTIGTVRTDKLKFTLYSIPAINIVIQASKIIEQGIVVVTHNLAITSTKGSKNITAITITNDSVLNATLQTLLNFNTLNGASQPVVTTLAHTNISVNKDYTVSSTDGKNTVTSTDSIRFYYPFLYGISDVVGIIHYNVLSKLIEAQGNKIITFNGINKYFWFGYPSSYPALTRIKDQNGFTVTDAFTIVLSNVISIGLNNNWTVEYRFYRTTLKTDINNHPYTFEF